MTRDTRPLFALLALTVCLGGCHTLHFDVAHVPSADVAAPVSEWHHFWLGGVVPTMTIDMRDKCPNGTAAVAEEITFLNGLVSTVALGIYTPRTSYYYCRLAPYVPAPPPAAPASAPPPPPQGVTP